MVSNKTIKGLDFETIEDYFQYILDSNVNGQKQQAKELYNKLSRRQINHFANWLTISQIEGITNNEDNLKLVTYLNS